jgi:very-short-patch-repair endonuclease
VLLSVTAPPIGGLVTRNHDFRVIHRLKGGDGEEATGRFRLGDVEEQQNLTWLSQLQYQAGVVSRQQALDAGFTGKAIEWRLCSGTWRRLHRRVYATFTGNLSREARLWAAVLWVGPGAVLSHETAAEIQHLTDKPSQRIHISVPEEQHPGRRTAVRGVVIHRSRGLVAEWQPPWHLPRTTVEDTVLDLIAAARTFDDAYGWVSAAVGRRLTTPELLGKALAGRARMRWRGWVAAALQARRRHGSGNRYLDNLYEKYGLCVELDGKSAHPAEGRWRDTRRDNANLVLGARTLRYGWPDVTEHRCRTAAEIAAVLRSQGWTGTLRRCGPSCTATRTLIALQAQTPGKQEPGK